MSVTTAATPTPIPTPAMMSGQGPRLVLALSAVYLIWSSTYLGMKVALATFPPFTLGALRFLVAGSILFALHRLRGGRLPTRREVLVAAPIGLLMFLAGNGFIAIAQHEVTSGVAAIVASTTPLWAALLGPLVGERARASEWLGVGLGTAGVVVLGANAELGGDWGMILILLLAPVGWAMGTMLSRRTASLPGFGGPALHMLWGGLGMAVAAPLKGEVFPTEVSADTVLVVAYLIVFGSLIGFTAFTWLLRNTRPTLALSYSYVNPIIAIALGAAFGGEPIHLTTVIATLILATAVAVVVRAAVTRPRREALRDAAQAEPGG